MVADKYIAEVMAAYDVVAEIFDDAYKDEKETEDHAQWLISVAYAGRSYE